FMRTTTIRILQCRNIFPRTWKAQSFMNPEKMQGKKNSENCFENSGKKNTTTDSALSAYSRQTVKEKIFPPAYCLSLQPERLPAAAHQNRKSHHQPPHSAQMRGVVFRSCFLPKHAALTDDEI